MKTGICLLMISSFALCGCNLSGGGSDKKHSSNSTSNPTSNSANVSDTSDSSLDYSSALPSNPSSGDASASTSDPWLSSSTTSTTDSHSGGSASTSSGGESVSNPKLEFWHNFGSHYGGFVNDSFIAPLKENDKIDIEASSKGSYGGLFEEICMSVATCQYPNFATGYPSDLATYARFGYPASRTGILLNLNTYLDDPILNIEHQSKYGHSLRDDFYPEYMVENNTIVYDENDNPLSVGLPFNKATEVMCYNKIFVDYAKSVNPVLGIPETWSDWETYGKAYRAIQMSLNGKYLSYTKTGEDTYGNFNVVSSKPSGTHLDFSEARDEESAILSWDSTVNMFITLVRQYGAQFTSYTMEDRHQENINDQHGYMEFYSNENKSKTIEAMEMVRRLSGDSTKLGERVFALPYQFGGVYSSDAFSKNKVMFVVCSSGGLSYVADQKLKIAPIPYKDAYHKYVMSQGPSLTIFERGSYFSESKYSVDEISSTAFNAIAKMTTGDYPAMWATKTGYYPTSKSATDSQIYQSFLNGLGGDIETITYRQSALLNQNEYMDSSKNWIKFVDPAFYGSNVIRAGINNVIGDIISKQDTWTIEQILQSYYDSPELSKFVRS